jgi:hypothetical protein
MQPRVKSMMISELQGAESRTRDIIGTLLMEGYLVMGLTFQVLCLNVSLVIFPLLAPMRKNTLSTYLRTYNS